MENLRRFTDEEIILRAKKYEKRMRDLQWEARLYMAGNGGNEKDVLRRYHLLRKEITQESNYLESSKGTIYRISDVHRAYQDGLDDCKRNGFSNVQERKVSNRIISILDEAIYRLTKELDYMGEYNK